MGKERMKKHELSERMEFARTHTQAEFCRRFNIKGSGASNFYKRYGIPNTKRFFKEYSFEEIAEYAVNHTTIEIAEHFNTSESNCSSFLLRYKLPYIKRKRGRPDTTKVDRNEMIQFLHQKYTCAAIGAVFGLTKERVRQICGVLGEDDEL